MGLGDPLRTIMPPLLSRRPPRPPPPVSSPTPLTPGSPQPGLLKAEPFPSAHPAALARSPTACWNKRRTALSAPRHRSLPRNTPSPPPLCDPDRIPTDCAYAGLTEWQRSSLSRFDLANRRRIAQIFLCGSVPGKGPLLQVAIFRMIESIHHGQTC